MTCADATVPNGSNNCSRACRLFRRTGCPRTTSYPSTPPDKVLGGATREAHVASWNTHTISGTGERRLVHESRSRPRRGPQDPIKTSVPTVRGFRQGKMVNFFAQGLWRLCSGEHGSRRNRRGHAHHEQLLRKGPFPSRLASVLIIELPWPRRESVVEEETGPGGCVCETLLEQRDEPGLLEVVVGSQGFADSAILHRQKRNAIR